MSALETLEIIDSRELLHMNPTEKDRQSYNTVVCNCLHHFHPKKEYEEQVAKVCFLAKEKVVLELHAEDGSKDEHSWGKKGRIVEAGTPRQRTVMTKLRLKRRLNDCCFVIIRETKIDDSVYIYTAERMPEVRWDEKTPLWEYPENTIVEVPLTFKDWKGFYIKIDKEGQDWVKEKRVEQLMKEFQIYLYVPIYFCKDTKHVRQGAHRLEVARRRGNKTIKVRIMRVWWKKFESNKWIGDTTKKEGS